MDRLKTLAILLRVAETGSFSRCAEEMGIGQPAVSKAVDGLEKELGVKLLHRNTRSLSLTEEGKLIFLEAKKVIDAYEELVATSQSKSLPRGVVRVTCPNALGSLYLIPALRRFMKEYPQITVHLRITDSYLDLYEHDIDVAFRIGELEADRIIAKRVGSLPRIVVGSRDYFKENPVPRAIPDLTSHSCIIVGKSGSSAVWAGTGPDKQSFSAEVNGRFVVDSHLALCAAVDAGMGIALGASFLFVDNGRMRKHLVQVLKKVHFKPFPVNVVFREAKNIPARIRLFIDFFYDDLRRQPWVEKAAGL